MLGYHEPEIINVGSGQDITIREPAVLVSCIPGFQERIIHDASKYPAWFNVLEHFN